MRELRDHRPFDAVEAGHLASLRDLLALPGDPFDRHRFEPGHVTASGFVLCPGSQRLLLIHHGALGRWLQPGGHVEPTDGTVREASAREVIEETGVALGHPPTGSLFDVDVHPIPAKGPAPAHRHYDVRFLWRAAADDVRVSAESSAVAWVALADLPRRYASPSAARIAAKLAEIARSGLE